MADERKKKSTVLPPEKEKQFRAFYADQAKRWDLDPNPDDPRHHYDYRAAWLAGSKPDETGHWPSEFKSPDHPNRYLPIGPGGEMTDTKTGKPAEKKHAALLAQLHALQAQKMAEMSAASAAPGAAYAPLLNAIRSRTSAPVTPKSAAEAAEQGRKWQESRAREAAEDWQKQRAQEAHEDYSFMPEGMRKPEYLLELKRRGVVPAAAPVGKTPYKMAPEMVIRSTDTTDANIDPLREHPIQYFPTREYPGMTGTYRDPNADVLVEPPVLDDVERRNLIEDELRQRKWERRWLPEFGSAQEAKQPVYKI